MASQRCLVADCGFCFATSALAPLASRRGKNWKSECRPDMIRMIENHRFLMFFLTLEEQNRVTGQAKRTFSLLSRMPANRNECPCCKDLLTTPANTSILSLTLKNQNFKFVTLTRAPSQPAALFFGISLGFQRDAYGISSRFLSDFYGISIVFLGFFYGISL